MKSVSVLLLGAILLGSLSLVIPVYAAETVGGWQVTDGGGVASEFNGTITLSGDTRAAGPGLQREFTPQTDFEISFQLKAETLGEVHRDPMGAGEGFGFGFSTDPAQKSIGAHFELRARGGGQFLLVWHDDLCDRYGWGCDWTPFVYNTLGYNDGSAYWHPNPPVDRSNSTVKPGVWYNVKLTVHVNPFTFTGEVYTENGTLLGALTVDTINDFTFKDIRYVGMSSGFGGTFYVRNITGITPTATFVYSPSEPAAYAPIFFDASNSNPQSQIANYAWNFGDGNFTSTTEPIISHAYLAPGAFNVTLTVSDSEGLNGSSSQTVRVWSPSYLSISTDSSSSTVGSAVNINGRLFDNFGEGIADEPVAVYFTFAGTDAWYPVSSAFTDGFGNFSLQWMNIASGTFTLRAQWQGNSTCTSANATTTLSVLPYRSQNVFFVESNSTITALAFNSTSSDLSFTVTGPSGTTGYAKATIAKNLLPNAENLKIYLDGKQLNYSLAETADSWLLTFYYSHSTHKLTINMPASEVSAEVALPTSTGDVAGTPSAPASGTMQPSSDHGIWIALITLACISAPAIAGIALRRKKQP